MGIEIERKFLLEKFPYHEIEQGRIQVLSRQTFEQTYLALTDQQELRVRKIEEEVGGQISQSFVHTFKEGQGLSRKEIEYEISEELYQQLLQGRKPLKKVRTKVLYEDTVMEIDEYFGFDLLTVEVEFASEEEAQLFSPPAWFGSEVGSEKEYRNKTLWVSLQNDDQASKHQEEVRQETGGQLIGQHTNQTIRNPAKGTIQIHSQVLSKVAKTLNASQICWAVGSSQLLAHYGIVEEPRDIDLLIEEGKAQQAEELVVQLGQQKELASKHPFLTKRFYQVVIDQAEVDVMCGFQIQHEAGVFHYPFDQSAIAFTKEIEGQTVPFTYLEDWYVLYSLIPGREHRVESIETYWKKYGIQYPDRLKSFLADLPEAIRVRVKDIIATFRKA